MGLYFPPDILYNTTVDAASRGTRRMRHPFRRERSSSGQRTGNSASAREEFFPGRRGEGSIEDSADAPPCPPDAHAASKTSGNRWDKETATGE